MSAYPPPPRRADGTVPPTAPDESPLEAEATLYAASPHHAADELLRRRRERKAQYGRSHAVLVGPSHRINPTYLMLAVLVLGFSYLVWRAALPARGGRGTLRATPPWTTTPTVTCTVPDKTMVSQKTFTLSSRSKGCHLVQAEVEHELRDMLKGVQAGVLTLFLQHTSAALSLNENYDKDVRTDMDMVRPAADPGARHDRARVPPVAPHGRGPRRLSVAHQGVAHRPFSHCAGHQRPHEPRHLAGHRTCKH